MYIVVLCIFLSQSAVDLESDGLTVTKYPSLSLIDGCSYSHLLQLICDEAIEMYVLNNSMHTEPTLASFFPSGNLLLSL